MSRSASPIPSSVARNASRISSGRSWMKPTVSTRIAAPPPGSENLRAVGSSVANSCSATKTSAPGLRVPAAEPGQVPSAPDQPRQSERELGELDLQLSLPAARPPGEDVQDDLPPVEHLDPQFPLQVGLLGRPPEDLEDDEVHALFPDRFFPVFP